MRHLVLALLLTTVAFADPCVKEVKVLQAEATGGAVLQGRVVLDRPAVGDNVWVELRAGDSVHVPMAVRVPAGEDSAIFSLCTDPVAQDQLIEVKASVRGVGPACAVKLVPEVAAVR